MLLQDITLEKFPTYEDLHNYFLKNSNDPQSIILLPLSCKYTNQDFFDSALSFGEFTKQQSKEFISKISQECPHPLLKARSLYFIDSKKNILDILEWYFYYFEYVMKYCIDPKWTGSEVDYTISIQYMLSSKLAKYYSILKQFAFYISEKNKAISKDFAVIFPFRTIIENDKKCLLGIKTYKDILIYLEDYLSSEFQDNTSSYQVFNDIISCAKKIKDSDLIKNCLEKQKQYLYNQISRSDNLYFKSSHLYKILNLTNNLQEKAEIHSQLEEIGKKIIKDMDITSYPLPNEEQNLIQKELKEISNKIEKSKNVIEGLFHIVYNPLSTLLTHQNLEDDKNRIKKSIVYNIVPVIYYDQGGTITYPVNSFYTIMVQFRLPIIRSLLNILKNRFEVSEEDIAPLIWSSKFIPENYRASTLQGIIKFLEDDWFSASRFLIPNSEAILGHIAKIHNIPTIGVKNKQGITEHLQLDGILKSLKNNSILEENILLEFRMLLLGDDEYQGYRLRHLMGHGLLDDNTSANHYALPSLWMMLIIVCFLGLELE